MTYLVNKKEGRLMLPNSLNWMVYDLKHRIRRVGLEMSRMTTPVSLYLRFDMSEMAAGIQVLRQLESDYVSRSKDDLNQGRKRHQYIRIQQQMAEHKYYNHWVFNRKFMKKTYGIDRGITVYKGDVYINNETGMDELFTVEHLSEFNGQILVHCEKHFPKKVGRSYVTFTLDQIVNEYTLNSVFVPDYSGAMPNQCPSCEDEIYYENGGYHAYNF